MSGTEQPARFYVNGIIALALLFSLTLMMAPAPAVNYVRAMIGVGLVVILLKMIVRRYRPHWLPGRFRGSRVR